MRKKITLHNRSGSPVYLCERYATIAQARKAKEKRKPNNQIQLTLFVVPLAGLAPLAARPGEQSSIVQVG